MALRDQQQPLAEGAVDRKAVDGPDALLSSSIDDAVYDPYRRHDRYGALGKAPQPLGEYVRLALLALFVFPLKVALFALCLTSLWAVCKLAPWVVRDAAARDRLVAAYGKRAARGVLLAMGFLRVDWVRLPGCDYGGGEARGGGGGGEGGEPRYGAVVCNHVSPIDIVVFVSRYFPSFVSKESVQRAPLVGAISKYLNCVFVDIKAKAAAKNTGAGHLVKERIQAVMTDPALRPVCIFPEGTTTNGRFLIQFKTGAFLAGVPVKPHVITYSDATVHPAWDTIDAMRLLALVLLNPMHRVTITELPVYVPSEAEKADPQLYAANVKQYMIEHSKLRPSESSYKQQLEYNAYMYALDALKEQARRGSARKGGKAE